MRRRFLFAAFIAGIAVGIRFSALPVTVFFIFAYFLEPHSDLKEKLRLLPALTFTLLLGIFSACPPIISTVKIIYSNGKPVDMHHLNTIIIEMLTRTRWEWDSVFSGGISSFSIAAIPMAFFMLTILVSSWRYFLILCVTISTFITINIGSETQYGWYWFPIIPILLFSLRPNANSALMKTRFLLLSLTILTNGYFQLPTIADFFYQKAEQIREVAKKDLTKQCIVDRLMEIKPAMVSNYGGFGANYDDVKGIQFINDPYLGRFANVELRDVRSLITFRESEIFSGDKRRIYAICSSVLVIVKEKQ